MTLPNKIGYKVSDKKNILENQINESIIHNNSNINNNLISSNKTNENFHSNLLLFQKNIPSSPPISLPLGSIHDQTNLSSLFPFFGKNKKKLYFYFSNIDKYNQVNNIEITNSFENINLSNINIPISTISSSNTSITGLFFYFFNK